MIDTANKRASVIGLALAFRLIAPTPGTTASIATREQTAYVYAMPAGAAPVVSQGVGNGAWIKLQGVVSHRIDFQQEGRRAKRLRLRHEKQEAEQAIAEAERLLASLPVAVVPEPLAPLAVAVEKAFSLPVPLPVLPETVQQDVSLAPKPITASASHALDREADRQAAVREQQQAERAARHEARAQVVAAIRAALARQEAEREWLAGEPARQAEAARVAQAASDRQAHEYAVLLHEQAVAADHADTMDTLDLIHTLLGML